MLALGRSFELPERLRAEQFALVVEPVELAVRLKLSLPVDIVEPLRIEQQLDLLFFIADLVLSNLIDFVGQLVDIELGPVIHLLKRPVVVESFGLIDVADERFEFDQPEQLDDFFHNVVDDQLDISFQHIDVAEFIVTALVTVVQQRTRAEKMLWLQ